MFAREWKARCPNDHKISFMEYLLATGVKEASLFPGFKGAEVFTRDIGPKVEFTLITTWDSLESIQSFAGNDINIAKLYPEDYRFELEPDEFVLHYEVEFRTLSKLLG